MVKKKSQFLELTKYIGGVITVVAPIIGIIFYFDPPEFSIKELVKTVAVMGYLILIYVVYNFIKEREQK